MNLSHIFLRDFDPYWFVSVMGTGISSTLLYNFPYHAHWLTVCSYIMFGINSTLLLGTTVLFLLGITIYRNGMGYIKDLKKSVFLGCYTMGLISWNNMLFFLDPEGNIIGCYVIWWVCVVLCIFTAWYLVFYMFKYNKIHGDEISTEYLLPVVPLTVVSSASGIIWSHLPTALKSSTLVISFILWANAIVISLMITTVYIWKLFIYKIPHRDIVFSSFIPIGFSGQGAYAIQLFGLNYYEYQLSQDPTSQESFIAAVAIKHITIFIGLMLQSLGYFLTFLAFLSVFSHLPNIRFTKNWWAMTFPMGTMSLAATETYHMTQWSAFKILGAIYGTALILITITCLIGSLIWETPFFWSSGESELLKRHKDGDLESGSSDSNQVAVEVDFMESNKTYL